MNRDMLSGQLDQIINTVILPLEDIGEDINPVYVANEVDKLIDPVGVSPELKTYASTLQIRGLTRKILAKRHDPVKKAQDYIEGEQDDLFSDQLQPYYPVKRTIEEVRESIYIRREKLTDIDVKTIASRMSKAGESLLEHVRALEAWHKGRAA